MPAHTLTLSNDSTDKEDANDNADDDQVRPGGER
jgi:hypothetical protein